MGECANEDDVITAYKFTLLRFVVFAFCEAATPQEVH